MVSHWIDVNAGDWYYNDIAEASAVKLEDGEPWITGIPYNEFWSDAPFLYQEFKGDGSTKVFTLSKKIIPTKANPLFVYVDGAQTVYDKIDNSGETTVVTLIAAPSKGAIVSFAIYGKPAIDKFLRPKDIVGDPLYPVWTLTKADSYYYDPFSRRYQEYCYAFGRQLRRAQVPDSDWETMSEQEVARKWIGYQRDVYCVSPAGRVYVPFNLNGVTCYFYYTYYEDDYGNLKHSGGPMKPESPLVVHTDRFFPEAAITRGEAYEILGKLRKSLYRRFTDSQPPKNPKTSSDKFIDVGKDLVMMEMPGEKKVFIPSTEGNASWVRHVLDMEKETVGPTRQSLVEGMQATSYTDITELENYTRTFSYTGGRGQPFKDVTGLGNKVTITRYWDVIPSGTYTYNNVDTIVVKIELNPHATFRLEETFSIIGNTEAQDSVLVAKITRDGQQISSRGYWLGSGSTQVVETVSNNTDYIQTYYLTIHFEPYEEGVGAKLSNGKYTVTQSAGAQTLKDVIRVDEWWQPIEGYQTPMDVFMGGSPITRAEAVAILNKFRKWSIEKFKL